MKKIIILAVAALVIAGSVVVASTTKNGDMVVAYLNGKEIKKTDLDNYVNTFLDDRYRKMMNEKEGMKKIAGYMIDRTILIDYAKKNLKKDSKVLERHATSKMEKDTMLVAAILAQEVNDKIKVTDQEVAKAMKDGNMKEERMALEKLKTKKRSVIFKDFITKVRSGHDIKYTF